MRQSRDQVLTSHAGSLPRPDALIEANRTRESGMATDERRFQDNLRSSVAEVVRLQEQAGIAIPGDGEFGKSMGHKVNYRAWWSYSFQRLGGLELGKNWDMVNPEPAVSDYKKFSMVRVEALNHAIKGLPEDRIRFHLCWGSWHGPHTTDIPMRDIVEVMLAVKCRAYSFEAANVRHEHEWKVWQDVKLPDGKLILPGIVSHATNVVEHPELVAERITRFANAVGKERMIASTDCGLGGRVHPQIAWAKLEALAQGAALATRQLWR
jgi:methionine synthase II (cobalamin-independent)